MQKQTVEFAVETAKDGTITNIGKSVILQPKTNYDGRKTNWLDDSRLIKANKKNKA